MGNIHQYMPAPCVLVRCVHQDTASPALRSTETEYLQILLQEGDTTPATDSPTKRLLRGLGVVSSSARFFAKINFTKLLFPVNSQIFPTPVTIKPIYQPCKVKVSEFTTLPTGLTMVAYSLSIYTIHDSGFEGSEEELW